MHKKEIHKRKCRIQAAIIADAEDGRLIPLC